MTNRELFEKFDELAEKLGSNNKAATAVGIAPAIISQLRSGSYKGNIEKQYDKLAEYFSVKAEAQENFEEIDYAPISTSKKVYSTIRSCHIRGGFAVITGDAGIGKTKAIRKYADDNSESAVVITANPCQKSAKATLKLLAYKLNVPVKSTDDMWTAIADKLHDGMVIIVDEAQLLAFGAIETLRSFADHFDSLGGQTLGVALVGNNGIRERIEGKTREIYRQVNNRTWQRPFLQTTDIKLSDMKLLFPCLAEDAPELKFLHKIAQSAEGVRGAVRLYANAHDNEAADLVGLSEMAKAMRIDIRGVDLNNI